jgi:hypothetical protein
VLAPGGFRLVWLDGEPGESNTLHLHASFRPAPVGGSLALSRLVGGTPLMVDYLNYYLPTPDRSYGSFPDGASSGRQNFFHVTPGGTNDSTPGGLNVFINEWMAANSSYLLDPADNDADDWFELYNAGPGPADLTGCFLTDTFTNRTQFAVPPGYVIPPGGYLLVWADNEPGQNPTNFADLHVNFRLNNDGEVIALYAPDGSLLDAVTFLGQTNNVSEGRFPNGSTNRYFFANPSPRTANSFNLPAPVITHIVAGDGPVQVTFTTQPGLRYQLQSTVDPVVPDWTPLGSPITAAGGTLTLMDAPGGAQMFYRVVVTP